MYEEALDSKAHGKVHALGIIQTWLRILILDYLSSLSLTFFQLQNESNCIYSARLTAVGIERCNILKKMQTSPTAHYINVVLYNWVLLLLIVATLYYYD